MEKDLNIENAFKELKSYNNSLENCLYWLNEIKDTNKFKELNDLKDMLKVAIENIEKVFKILDRKNE